MSEREAKLEAMLKRVCEAADGVLGPISADACRVFDEGPADMDILPYLGKTPLSCGAVKLLYDVSEEAWDLVR